MTVQAKGNRFIQQAADDYIGKPVRIAFYTDAFDEKHVIVENKVGKTFIYLCWIGAELAPEPDEFEDEPFPNLNWQKIV